MSTMQIYVQRLDEGTEVFRPVEAEIIGEKYVRLIKPVPEDEVWRFQPDQVVVTKHHLFADGVWGALAIAALEDRE